MKIKTTKHMRLDELIKYIFDNDIRNTGFESSNGVEITVGSDGIFEFLDMNYAKDDLFTVQVEEEVTEKTVFDKLLFTYKNPSGCIRTACYEDSSMDDINKKFDVVGLRSLLIVHDNGLTTEIWNAVDGFLDDVVKDKDNA
ncbi:hypothetical protein ACFOU0_12330 [Salinicoccus sesuvii]|uniref:Uncharacterized protein n=1 Tax=Salinicoccus sesuvii TaxID=868281 RepID=A0ABV7N6Z9_9STAP